MAAAEPRARPRICHRSKLCSAAKAPQFAQVTDPWAGDYMMTKRGTSSYDGTCASSMFGLSRISARVSDT